MKYLTKPIIPVEVDAIQFEYTETGIKALRAFCGEAVGNIGKARTPYALGFADVKGDGVVYTVVEKDWVLKLESGELTRLSSDAFSRTYEPV